MSQPTTVRIANYIGKNYQNMTAVVTTTAKGAYFQTYETARYSSATVLHEEKSFSDEGVACLYFDSRFQLKLVNKNGRVVTKGEMVTCSLGDHYQLDSIDKPHKPSSTGRVYVTKDGEFVQGFFPSVFDLTWKIIDTSNIPDNH